MVYCIFCSCSICLIFCLCLIKFSACAIHLPVGWLSHNTCTRRICPNIIRWLQTVTGWFAPQNHSTVSGQRVKMMFFLAVFIGIPLIDIFELPYQAWNLLCFLSKFLDCFLLERATVPDSFHHCHDGTGKESLASHFNREFSSYDHGMSFLAHSTLNFFIYGPCRSLLRSALLAWWWWGGGVGGGGG